MRKRQENEVILSYKVSGQYLLNYLLIHAKKWKHYIPFSDVSERMLKILKLQFYQPIILSNAPDTVPWSFLFDFYSGGGDLVCMIRFIVLLRKALAGLELPI